MRTGAQKHEDDNEADETTIPARRAGAAPRRAATEPRSPPSADRHATTQSASSSRLAGPPASTGTDTRTIPLATTVKRTDGARHHGMRTRARSERGRTRMRRVGRTGSPAKAKSRTVRGWPPRSSMRPRSPRDRALCHPGADEEHHGAHPVGADHPALDGATLVLGGVHQAGRRLGYPNQRTC